MIDIHCHILPMVDDGSDSVETSLEMLDAAWQDGTDALILTPHYAVEYGFDNPKEKIRMLFAEFKDIVRQEGIPVRLYLGCEFLFSGRESFVEHIDDIALLNQTNHQLMEFYFDVEEEDVLDAIDAVKAAVARKVDMLIIDTAGRLQTKSNLMQELEKINRVIGREIPGAPHETLLVLDATTGQNAISQAELFTKAAPITGVVLTKLDGTAKGGVVIGIKSQLSMPVKWIGVGEGVEDLRPFNAEDFAKALFGN